MTIGLVVTAGVLLFAFIIMLVLYLRQTCDMTIEDPLLHRSCYVHIPYNNKKWLRMSLDDWKGEQADIRPNEKFPAHVMKSEVSDRYLVYSNLTHDSSMESYTTHAGVTILSINDTQNFYRSYYPTDTLRTASVLDQDRFKWLTLEPISSKVFDIETAGYNGNLQLKMYRVTGAYATETGSTKRSAAIAETYICAAIGTQ